MLSPEEEQELQELEELARMESQSDPGPGRRKALQSGAATGVVGGTIGAPADIAGVVEMGRKAAGIPRFLNIPPMASMLPSTKEILGGVDKTFGTELDYEPKTQEEKYTKSVSAGATGMMLPGGKMNLMAKAMVGGAAGGAGEAAEQASGSGILGGVTNLATLLLGHSVAARKPQVVKAAQSDLKSVDEPTLRAAAQRATEIEGRTGQRPLLSQAIDEPTALSGLTDLVGKSSQGDAVRKVLSKEMSVGQEKIDDLVNGISRDLLGQDAANQVLRAGDKAIKRPGEVAKAVASRDYKAGKRDTMPVVDEPVVRGKKKTTTSPVYDQEGNLVGKEKDTWARQEEPAGTIYDASAVEGNRTNWKVQKTTIDDLIGQLHKRAEELSLDGGSKSGKPFYEAADKLARLAAKYPDGVPFGHLDVLQREHAKLAKLAKSATAKRKDVLGELANEGVSGILNDALKRGSDAMRSGKSKYSRVAEAYGEKINQSPMTEMFTESARQAGKGEWDQMTVVLNDSKRFSPKDIQFVAENMRRADPEAFPMLVRQAWESKVSKAREAVGGRTPQQSMGDWVSTVAGPQGSKERENFKETIRQIARSRGQDTELAAAAADRLMDDLQVFSRERGSVGKIDAGEIRRDAGRNKVSSVLRSVGIFPQWPMAEALQRQHVKQVYNKLSNMLTDPQGFQQIIDIAQFDPTMVKLDEFARSLVETSAYQQAQ